MEGDFKFRLTNWLNSVDPRFGKLLDASEELSVVEGQGNSELGKPQATFYVVLAALMPVGRAIRLVQATTNLNGFEAWRAIASECQQSGPSQTCTHGSIA